VLLGLQLGGRESYEAWLSFGRDLVDRGLNAPALVVADGAPGLWRRPASYGLGRTSSAAPSTRSDA
jgi:transposase-like protein